MREPALIVADHEVLRESLADVLGRDGDLDPLEATTCTEAVELFARHDPALVLLDMSLPDHGGMEVLRQVRTTSATPVILLTGVGLETERVVGLELGADDYVLVPCSPREVAARARTVLRRARSNPPDRPLCFDELVIDPASCEVRRGERVIEVTARELALLLHLASHPRRVFTRDDLLHAVWASEPGWQSPATVTEHVHRLRTKIEDDRARPRWLRTVRGIGYRFEP